MKKAPATEVAKRHAQRQYNSGSSYAERITSLVAALHSAGIEPLNTNHVISRLADGQLVRFKTATKHRKNNGWIVVHFNRGLPAVAVAGDWKTGAELKWVASHGDTLTEDERRQLKRQIEEAQRRRNEEQQRKHEATAIRAETMWLKAGPAPAEHPYLVRKGITPHNARLLGNKLMLSLIDFTGRIWSLQLIDTDGDKRLLSGGKKAGHFIVAGGTDYPKRVLICEGWATGRTLAEQMPNCLVLAAIDAGNLATVAKATRKAWPTLEVVICGDDDRQTKGNPGKTAARAAADAANCSFALPKFPHDAPQHLSDFNDLASWQRGTI
jgi:putative DNA primase/helicase